MAALEAANEKAQKELIRRKRKLAQLTKHNMAYNYMIKRNKKEQEKAAQQKKKQSMNNIRIKLPFLLVNAPDNPNN